MCRIISAIICTVLIIPGLIAQETLQIPDDGWRLWPDTAADWENDTLYLPDEVNLDKIPVNIPTGGWEILTPTSGREVELPATVEQYYWGNFGFRPYKNAYYFEEEDNQVQNGNYPGVSWWWIEFDIPENFQDKQITLFIRAARLRAEVYLNRQLVGYHIIGETSFICDLTAAAKPGEKNLLAIRITNPGGRFDWVDTGYLEWGDYRLHASHGFGGLDRGIILTAHDPVYLSDLWTASTPDIKTIIVHGKITSKTDEPVSYQCKIRLLEYDSDRIIREIETEWGTLTAYGTATLQEKISYPDAAVWNIDSPNLYRAELEVISGLKQKKKEWVDKRQVTCAFRWFEAAGIDENALLLLNGERIRLISAISWGFWGLNGLWPTPELAEKEVLAAKAFGMNCINFHRNIGKTEVLEAQDRLGLLR
ncbi:MAG: glycoside hydrolase, partial [Calditrichaeota bacterium]